MRLADFIQRDMQVILGRWEAFAASRLPAAEAMHSLELRDHAQQILEAVVTDLRAHQSPEAQSAKSMGLAPTDFEAAETAAQTHAVLRAKSGFDIHQLASEYRALRASVLSLWIEACRPAEPFLDDVIRFNEAIDQALAESIGFFSTHVERSRNLLIGMLSHDLRSPLQTIQMTARYLQQLNASENISQAAERLVNGGARMQALLNDLVDYNRTELGLGIRVTPQEVDLGSLCEEELDQIRSAHPHHRIALNVAGNCRGSWDGRRIQQLLNNLVVNAVHYGAPDATIGATLQGSGNDVRITVENRGPIIDRMTLGHIFEPLKRGPVQGATNHSGLGLGLYIAAEIARAHGGEISVTSAEMRTEFVVRLPRTFPSQQHSILQAAVQA
jgi:signal transduction histidine kinase